MKNIQTTAKNSNKTKIQEMLYTDNEFTSLRVSRMTLDALAQRGKFRDTFDIIIQRLLSEADQESKLQSSVSDGGSF